MIPDEYLVSHWAPFIRSVVAGGWSRWPSGLIMVNQEKRPILKTEKGRKIFNVGLLKCSVDTQLYASALAGFSNVEMESF